MSQRAFVTLDGMRGIAALAVVTRHAPVLFHSVAVEIPQPHGALLSVGPFFESYLAVDFFFALSGFVLAHAYEQRLREGLTAGRFMAMRLIRLYPLYFTALLLGALYGERAWAWNLLPAHDLTLDLVFAFYFLPSPASPYHLFPLNQPSWSLFNELIANAAFAITGGRLKTSWLAILVATAGLTLAGGVVFQWPGFDSAGCGALNIGPEWRSMAGGLARVTYGFFAGVLTYRAWRRWGRGIQVPVALVVLPLAAILVAHPAPAIQDVYDLAAALVAFPCLIFLGAGCMPRGRTAQVLTQAGVASYAVYVLQGPVYLLVISAVSKLAGHHFTELPLAWGVLFVAALVGLALFCDRYIDRPVRRALSGFFRKQDAAQTA